MSADFVFTGPTLPPAQVTALLPGARVQPPVRHGDLLHLEPRPGDRVLIIDGLFLQTASVRHREILYLLERGVTVAGSSSMGALRAAELWRYGMRGFGEVFRLYRDGEIDGDDEVAIVHGTAEDGYRAYSDPLVSIRVAVRDAAAAGVISGEDARAMLDLATAMPFRSRSFRALDLTARGHVPGAAAFARWRAARDTDIKAADARLMLAAAAAGDPRLRPAGAAHGDEPARHVHTRMFDGWEHKFRGQRADGHWVSDRDCADAIKLAYPGFSAAYRDHVLAQLTGASAADPALTAQAAALATAKGLTVDGAAACGWLTAADLAKTPDELLATLLARMAGTRMPVTTWGLPPAMRTPAAQAWGRDFAATARQCRERLGPRRFRPEAVDTAISLLWDCDAADLQPRAWDRGIADLTTLRRLAEPFVAHLKVLGAPPAPAATG